jgi:hypothetical protein
LPPKTQSPPQQPIYQPSTQQPVYQPRPQQPVYQPKPQQTAVAQPGRRPQYNGDLSGTHWTVIVTYPHKVGGAKTWDGDVTYDVVVGNGRPNSAVNIRVLRMTPYDSEAVPTPQDATGTYDGKTLDIPIDFVIKNAQGGVWKRTPFRVLMTMDEGYGGAKGYLYSLDEKTSSWKNSAPIRAIWR